MPETNVGWRMFTGFSYVRFDISLDDGVTWATTHFWDGSPTTREVLRVAVEVLRQYPHARPIEYQKINGKWSAVEEEAC
jgi:hypothetical protein